MAAQCCHIGQPVKIDGEQNSALRIGMGARIIADSQHDATHLETELRQVRVVLDKTTLCIERLISCFDRRGVP